MTESTITDWIQAIGMLLGVPTAIWGIISLFKRDKEKEKQINSLVTIANQQIKVVEQLKDQTEQLIIQSGHMQYEGMLMLESNKLLERQIEIQTDVFLFNKEAEGEKVKIEKQKRITQIKPYFFGGSSGSGPNDFFCDLFNKGGNAMNVEIRGITVDFVWFNPLNITDVDSGMKLTISGGCRADKTYLTGNQVTFEIELMYHDVDKNNYKQNIKRISNGKYIIGEPILQE